MLRPVSSLLVAMAPLAAQRAPQPTLDYGRDVRPILANACFACHGPDAGKRKADLRLDVDGGDAHTKSGKRAVVPGDAAASELLRRIALAAGDDDKMPPTASGKVLDGDQVATLRRWLEEGAVRTPHWAFVPPERPGVPDAGATNPIDAFVVERLKEQGLAPSPPADPATLLRRLTLDLTGLPPTPEAVAAFVADPSPDAWVGQIDRLFASPRYAEHMARQWLDLARYGDTHGFHLDNVRTMWPYRDWVVGAFAANLPFDRFTVEQLAGDLLPAPTRDQLIATGFNRCNPTTAEGGLIDAEYLAKYASDRVATTATVWMGLTMQCAACHDHKFDPISQRDFYRMFAFFDSIDEQASDNNAAFAPPDVEVPTPEQERERADLQAQRAAAAAALDAPDPEIDAAQRLFETGAAARLLHMWRPLVPVAAHSREGATLVREPATGAVLITGNNPATDVHEVVLRTDLSQIAALRVEALLDPKTGKVGRGDNGNFVLTAVEVEAAPLGAPERARPVVLVAAAADHAQPDFGASKVIDADAGSGWATVDAMAEPHELVLAPEAPFGFAGGTLVRLRLHYESVHARHALARVRVSASEDARLGPAAFGVWSSSGPHAAPAGGSAFATAFAPEREALRPGVGNAEGERAPSSPAEPVTWTPRPDLADGRVHELTKVEQSATYLRREVGCGSDRAATLSFGSDDDLVVWCNGEKVLAREVARSVAPDQDRVRVHLRAGTNVLLAKVVNRGGGCAFSCRVVGEELAGMPVAVAHEVLRPPSERTAAGAARLRSFYRRIHSSAFRAREQEVVRLEAALDALAAAIPHTMVMRERKQHRDTRVLVRGQYDHPGDHVSPGVPAMFAQLGPSPTRLDLARWLVSGEHPLVARVLVNRLWAQLFGRGIVRTPEDFGYQGAWPSHPPLLDWLATELVASGWDVQHVLRTILTSATYRQTSSASAQAWERDPDNRLLARGPRVRLDAEVIRDQALFVSGLLVDRLGGPGVNPYQPSGLWEAVGYVSSNTARFTQDHGDALYRRSLYTFWKRTSPPASMALFDAPTREACVVARSRTNTPTQALALLNDVQQVEAARHLAERVLRVTEGDAGLAGGSAAVGSTAAAGLAVGAAAPTPVAAVVGSHAGAAAEPSARKSDGADADRVIRMGRLVLGRDLDARECAVLVQQKAAARAHYAADVDAARALVAAGETPVAADLDPVTLAAWTMVAQTLLNLDETVTKR